MAGLDPAMTIFSEEMRGAMLACQNQA